MVDLSVEQQTQVKTEITALNVEPVVNIDFDISVGTVVPKTVVLHPVPAKLVTLFPQWKGFLFFILADGRIVIVAPDSLKIVVIIA